MNKSPNPVKNCCSIIPTSAGDKAKLWFYGEVALICLLITGVWSLVSLPLVFYHLPKSETPRTDPSGGNSVCSAPVQYATISDICRKELDNTLISSNCLPDPGEGIAVMSNDEVTARQLINGFASLGASAECLSKAVPFLCLHVFGLCGGSGVSIQPTSSQCEEIRDTTCQQQWMYIERLDIGLPNCEIFPSESLSCPALNDSLSINATVTTNMLDPLGGHSSGNAVEVRECSGDFYQENGSSYCTRSCSSWVQFGSEDNVITDVLTLLFTSISILTAAAIIIISCSLCKRMLIFPSIFIIYIFIDYLVLDLFIFVGLMDRDKLFCTSRSLSKSLREVTSFCIIFGVVFTYIICQLALWWLLHTAALFWKVIFPLHALYFEKSGKNKYIHITCIIVGILLPLVPIITTISDTAVDFMEQNDNSTFSLTKISKGLGFGPIGFPPILCTAINPEATFYSLLLMVDLILGCGCTMLIIIFWSVHKRYIKRKQLQENVNLKNQFTFGTAEKKLLAVFCYYVVMVAVVLTVFTWDVRNGPLFKDTIQKFLICELGSYNSSNLCTFSDPDSLGFDLLQILSFILLNLLPAVNLLYVVNFQELKQLWRKWTLRGPPKNTA